MLVEPSFNNLKHQISETLRRNDLPWGKYITPRKAVVIINNKLVIWMVDKVM